MKTIKKIQTAQIDPVSGAVVDSMTGVSDKTTNAPSIRAVDEAKQNTILSGTTTPSDTLGEDGDVYIQYEDETE